MFNKKELIEDIEDIGALTMTFDEVKRIERAISETAAEILVEAPKENVLAIAAFLACAKLVRKAMELAYIEHLKASRANSEQDNEPIPEDMKRDIEKMLRDMLGE